MVSLNGMKQLLLICAVVIGQSVLAADKKPLTKEESAKIIEAEIRYELNKPIGELTKADWEKVTKLGLYGKELTEVPKGLEKLAQLTEVNLTRNQLTSVKGLEKLTKLKWLKLYDNKLTSVKGLEKLTQLKYLFLHDNQLTDVKGLEKLTKLRVLNLEDNLNLTKAQIDQLQKALPNCEIVD